MFTSRAEYRLLLREDSADLRLIPLGHELGLIDDSIYKKYLKKKENIEKTLEKLGEIRLKPNAATNSMLKNIGTSHIKNPVTLRELLKRPEVNIDELYIFDEGLKNLPQNAKNEVSFQAKYEGYIKLQKEQVERFKKFEYLKLPPDIDYYSMIGLSNEVKEKLTNIKPASLGQAGRISGITPAALIILQIYLKKRK
jgi:tRNA uridine 5-carboxymethylaminomethyl modification enzyme